jgi:hypothetical protein
LSPTVVAGLGVRYSMYIIYSECGHWTRSSRTQLSVSINVWRLAGDTLNIIVTFWIVIIRRTETFWSLCTRTYVVMIWQLISSSVILIDLLSCSWVSQWRRSQIQICAQWPVFLMTVSS